MKKSDSKCERYKFTFTFKINEISFLFQNVTITYFTLLVYLWNCRTKHFNSFLLVANKKKQFKIYKIKYNSIFQSFTFFCDLFAFFTFLTICLFFLDLFLIYDGILIISQQFPSPFPHFPSPFPFPFPLSPPPFPSL